MATSGTVTYSQNELTLYTDALQNLGVYGAGETLTADDVALCRRKLNMLVKQWVSQIDFAPGLKLWTRRRAYLFLQDGQIEYDLGPSGDHTAEGEYTTTTLTAAAVTSDTALTVASIADIATTNAVGVELDSGAIHWTTVNGAPSGSTVTLAAGLASSASIGRRVFAYAAKMRRPFEIVSASLRSDNGNDSPMDPNMGVDEYELISRKSGAGTPYRMYFEPRTSNARVFLDCAPSDVTRVVRMVYLSYIEDLTTTTGDLDFPPEWYRPLSAQLAVDLAPAFEVAVSPGLKQLRDDALTMARNAYPAKSTAYFASEPDEY